MKNLQIPLNSLSVLFNTIKLGSFWKAIIMMDIITRLPGLEFGPRLEMQYDGFLC